jgi:AcrR family transcriptional regulator
MPSTPTRDRLVAEAMRLFGRQGYQATSITQIEAAAGLTPGSGALYHHFKSKEALLDAGIDRQLDRRRAMHDIRALFAGLGDLRIELTMLGRYVLSVLDEEAELLQVAARTPPEQSARLNSAYAALIGGLNAEVADWIEGWAPKISAADARTIAAVGVNALLGKRAAGALFHNPETGVSDEQYLAQWTAMLAGHIQSAHQTEPGR